MSTWSDQYDQHPVFEHLKGVGSAIDEALGREGITSDQVVSVERVRKLLTFIGQRIASADPELIRDGVLDAIATYLPGTSTHLKQFATDGDAGNLVHAHNHIEKTLGACEALVVPQTAQDLEALRNAAQAYRETMSTQLRAFGADIAAHQKLVDSLGANLGEAQVTFANARAEIEGALNSFKAETEAAQATLVKTYQGAEERVGAAVDAKLTEWQTKFDASETARKATFEEESRGQAKTFDAIVTKWEGTLKATDSTWDQKLSDLAKKYETDEANLKETYEAVAGTTLATIEGNLRRVQELVGAIGDHGVTAGFKREADDARTEVVYWQRVTFWSMLFLILVGIATAFHVFEYTLTWIALASRLYLSIATGVLAAYAANQASRYQQRERRNRKLELELRALGPFLEPVDPTEREKFRLKIAEVFFGKDDGITDKPGPTTPLELSKGTVDKVLDVAKAAIDKFPGTGS